ncbi:hypothetical protein ACHHYP_11869 [Achlya hypogyna]|uniref:PDZ domain-containing protein n=1 Tax=Achlya hypogyna TaxID=1202772 RepID=A0A1V9YI51_ACHHY|nr:hypothetical protein ACHHYP_11869 [Achlya hypogyna]
MWFKPKPAKFAAFKQAQEEEAGASRRGFSLALRSERNSLVRIPSARVRYANEHDKFCPTERRPSCTLTASTSASELVTPRGHRRCSSHDLQLPHASVELPPAIYLHETNNQLMDPVLDSPLVLSARPSHRRSTSLGSASLNLRSLSSRRYKVHVPPLALLGVCLEERQDDSYVVHSVHPSFSGCLDVFSVTVGDELVAIDGDLPGRLAQALAFDQGGRRFVYLQPANVARVLVFEATAPTPRAVSSSREVLWLPHQTLGLVFHEHRGRTAVERVVAFHNPGMRHVQVGDTLVAVNGASVGRLSFAEICDHLAGVAKPALLRFEPHTPVVPLQLLSNGCIYHVVWSDGGPLNIALKPPTDDGGFPFVSHRKEEAGHYKSTTHAMRISRGDLLVKVNHQCIRDVLYIDLLAQLRSGPKPMILSFYKRVAA